ncbi:hypothetical protein AN5091.2 [Aspergillus nidulans FGSC A4]|nr:hypothetical protein AN5091.2 [Aspergillus nidulans FGSC A4]|eukprot:XP_662695.1 hypothetical protein AN5091.2 [Aspergillus nidulans FGSC A4]
MSLDPVDEIMPIFPLLEASILGDRPTPQPAHFRVSTVISQNHADPFCAYPVPMSNAIKPKITQRLLTISNERRQNLERSSAGSRDCGGRVYSVNPQAILDVGTGTGIWAIDVADAFPAARVTGLDLSPIQPTFVPPTCSFEIDDVTMPWTYDTEQFDLIYVREMFGSIPDWDAFLRQCWASLRPGGYIEVVEHSITPIWDADTSLGPIYALWEQTMAQVEQVSGRSFSIWRESAQVLEGSGFQDITKRSYKWPISGCVTC